MLRRAFSSSRVVRGLLKVTLADILKDLYLSELRKYVPSATTIATDLKDTFTLPPAPPKPQVETTKVSAVADTEAMKEEEWPALYNAIDDPANFNDALEWEKDDGSWYPKRLYPRDYDHH